MILHALTVARRSWRILGYTTYSGVSIAIPYVVVLPSLPN